MTDSVQAMKAQAAAEAGHYAAAVQHFAAALLDQPDNAELHEQQAQCLMELEQYDAAAAASERATELRPSWPEGWLTLSRSLLNGGRLQAAQYACLKCLDLDPNNADAKEDLLFISQLVQQQTAQLVGLPGLDVVANPLGQTGPGCVIWEAGVQLACLFVQLARLQQAERSETGSHHAASRQPIQETYAELPPEPPETQPNQLGHACLSDLPALQGARLLELGAGTGIAGIAAAACGAHVTLTDLADTVPLLCANIARNETLLKAGVGGATAAVLDWTSFLGPGLCLDAQQQLPVNGCSSGADTACDYDWGFGADLVFNAAQVDPVVQAISCFLRAVNSPHQCRCFLLAHKQRHVEVDSQLLHSFAAAGCILRQVENTQERATGQVRIWLLRLAAV